MSNMRVVSFDGLLAKLETVLGEDSLLYQRFDYAFRNKDEDAIEAAMQSLQIYPQETRQSVEDAIISWLFDDNDNSGLNSLKMHSANAN